MSYPRPSSSDWKRHGRKQLRLPKNWLKNLLLVLLILGVAGTLGLLGLFAYVSRDLPDPNALTRRTIKQSTKIYDRTGEHLLYEIHGDENRTLVKIQDGFCDPDFTSEGEGGIPLVALQATIAAEDRAFCDHGGFTVRGIGRAVLFGGSRGGGSTLTQQLVKNAILSNERTLTRKVKELILSVELERRYAKDEILQIYFNEIPYGSTYYGIQAAATNFFGKTVDTLTLAETATLAAIPQLPTYYINNPDRLKIRRDWILDSMAELEFISQSQADEAKAQDTPLRARVTNIQAPHFVFYVKELLETQFGQRQVEEGGLRVVTSLDYDLQKAAEEAVVNGVNERGEAHNFTNASLVAADPHTGQILAMVGSKDYFNDAIAGKVNVALRPRQPGSSFKPIVFAQAFDLGYTPNTVLWDVKTDFPTATGPYSPNNYDLRERGPIRIREVLQGSLNIPAVQMLYMVGVERALDFAASLGYSTFQDRSRFGLAIVLGGGEVQLLEHTLAYGALGNGGRRFDAAPILEVTDPDGNVLMEWKQTDGDRVLSENASRMVTNVLTDNAARSYVFGPNSFLQLGNIPAAAKSGTTNRNYDAWTVGYVPSLVTGVWVGNADNSRMGSRADGSVVAAPIWNAFMRAALAGKPVESFPAPDIPQTGKPVLDGEIPSTRVVVDRASDKLATEFTPASYREERLYAEYHSLLHYVNRADPLGPPPENPERDPHYEAWEAAIADWMRREEERTGIVISSQQPPTEYDDVHVPANQPSVFLAFPQANDTLFDRMLDVSADAFAPRGVSRMEFYLGGKLVGVDTSAPYTLRATLPGSIGRGTHTLKVVAYDDVDNAGSASVNIRVETDAESAGADIVDPRHGQNIDGTETYMVAVSLDRPQQYGSVALYAQRVGQAERTLVGLRPEPDSPFVQFAWTLPMEGGDWILTATAEGRDGLPGTETAGYLVHVRAPQPQPSSEEPTEAPLNPFAVE